MAADSRTLGPRLVSPGSAPAGRAHARLPFCGPPRPQGRASHALWQAWALMEQKQGDRALVRPLFRRGLEARCAPGPPPPTHTRPHPPLADARSAMLKVDAAPSWDPVQSSCAWLCRVPGCVRAPHPAPFLPRPPAALPPPPRRSPRSRYTHLAWALWEKEEGNLEEARRLFKQGAELNPRDAAILQVGVFRPGRPPTPACSVPTHAGRAGQVATPRPLQTPCLRLGAGLRGSWGGS